MPRILYLLIFFPVWFISCNNGNSNNVKSGNTTTAADSTRLDTAAVKPWYKRYTGTVVGQGVIVNLYQLARNEFRGTFNYNSKGILMELNGKDDSCRGSNLFLYESNPTERSGTKDFENNPHWQVTLSGDKLVGKWISKDGSKTYPIELTEDYSGGALRLDVFSRSDSQKIKHGKAVVTNNLSYMWPEPSPQVNKPDADYLLSVIKQKLGAKDISGSINNLATANIQKSFAEFKANIDTGGPIDESAAYMFSQESNDKIWADYNQNGFVVLEFFTYQYMGGAHGNYGSSYLNVDMQLKKVWGMNDMMHIDTLKLMSLLDEAAHREFQVSGDSDLSISLMVDTIPITNNCFFTHTGITFNYVPYEIACFADGEIQLFIPFTRLMDMLTPEFKKRMKMK